MLEQLGEWWSDCFDWLYQLVDAVMSRLKPNAEKPFAWKSYSTACLTDHVVCQDTVAAKQSWWRNVLAQDARLNALDKLQWKPQFGAGSVKPVFPVLRHLKLVRPLYVEAPLS